MKKKINYYYLIICILCVILFIILKNNIFGSNVDWINQHTTFPDYFRNLFYKTHNLFPDFSLSLGGGQNIYHFSYYGLYSPIILLSYLFVNVKMVDYIIISHIILIFLGSILMFKWLKNNFNDEKLSFIGSLIYVCSGPLIFHSHHHLMFVNYLPFLILSLILVDKYIKNNKTTLLTIAIFLIITSSYYYSIPSIIVIYIYYLYKKLHNNINIKELIISILKFSKPVILAILLSSILLLPTFTAILENNNSVRGSFNILNTIMPNFQMSNILYSAYSLGLTSISITSLLHIKKNQNDDKFIKIILFLIVTIPLFLYLLNGMLYVRTKILIPFIPLFIYTIILFIKDFLNRKINLVQINISFIIIMILSMIYQAHSIFIFDSILLLIIINICYRKKLNKVFIAYIVILSLFIPFINNDLEHYITKDKYLNTINNDIQKDIEYIKNKDKDFYRIGNIINQYDNINRIYTNDFYTTSIYSSVYNKNYHKFFDDIKITRGNRNVLEIANVENLLLSNFLNHKYILSDRELSFLEKVENTKYLYKNNSYLPFIYLTNNLYSEDLFNGLNEFEKQELLLNGSITNNGSGEFTSKIKEVKLDYDFLYNDTKIIYKDDYYIIDSVNNNRMSIKINEGLKNKLLLISFDLLNDQSCDYNDLTITINNVKNIKTCYDWYYSNKNSKFTYVLGAEDLEYINVLFTKGKYAIKNIKTYTLDYNDIKDLNKNISHVDIDYTKSIDNTIYLKTNEKEDKYLVTSLGYDNNFNVYINDKLVNKEKINKYFLGFKVEKGNNNIKIVYKAKYKDVSLIISTSTLIIITINYFIEKKKKY